MQYTDNYNFKKPEDSDAGDVAYLNDNFDAIDAELKAVNDDIDDISQPATPTTAGLMSAGDKAKLDEGIDYVVESGSKTTGSGSNTILWTYTKWKSGLVEAVGVSSTRNVTPSALMGGYYANITGDLLPFSRDETRASILLPRGILGSGVTFTTAGINGNMGITTTVWGNQSATTAKFEVNARFYTNE